MSAGPDELHLREFREASELITDPLEAFLEAAQTTAEVFQDQQKAGRVSVFRNGSAGAGQAYEQHHTTAGKARLSLGVTGRSIT